MPATLPSVRAGEGAAACQCGEAGGGLALGRTRSCFDDHLCEPAILKLCLSTQTILKVLQPHEVDDYQAFLKYKGTLMCTRSLLSD